VDGCFWHGCPEHGVSPKANSEWWAEKLHVNAKRDAATDALLESAGWEVIRVWEHVPASDASHSVQDALARRRQESGRSRNLGGDERINESPSLRGVQGA